jgi:hypothetical protein
MSFVNEIFIPNFYNKLGIRKDTFLEIFTHLEKKESKQFCIIETGASRGGPNDLNGNGSSTFLFDKFINFYDGKVISFELNKSTVDMVNSGVSEKTTVICKDSIEGIISLMNSNIYEIDLLYLDSLDTKFDSDNDSAEHALNEFRNAIFYLRNKSLILIDDTPSNIDFLPPWVKNDKKRGGNKKYMDSLSFPCGKGRKVIEFINDKPEFEITKHHYQVCIKYNVTEKIPKIFHRTWKTKEVDYQIFKPACVESWAKYNDEYEFILHDDKDNRKFIETYYPWFLKIYDGYKRNIMRADAVRYFYLLYFGGIYVDLDFECLKPLDQYLTKQVHFITNLSNWVSNAFMVATPQQYIFKEIIVSGLLKNYNNPNVLYSTGPGMLSKLLLPKHLKYMSEISLPEFLFYPIKYTEPFEQKYSELGEDVVCVHHFANSWNK